MKPSSQNLTTTSIPSYVTYSQGELEETVDLYQAPPITTEKKTTEAGKRVHKGFKSEIASLKTLINNLESSLSTIPDPRITLKAEDLGASIKAENNEDHEEYFMPKQDNSFDDSILRYTERNQETTENPIRVGISVPFSCQRIKDAEDRIKLISTGIKLSQLSEEIYNSIYSPVNSLKESISQFYILAKRSSHQTRPEQSKFLIRSNARTWIQDTTRIQELIQKNLKKHLISRSTKAELETLNTELEDFKKSDLKHLTIIH